MAVSPPPEEAIVMSQCGERTSYGCANSGYRCSVGGKRKEWIASYQIPALGGRRQNDENTWSCHFDRESCWMLELK